MMLKLTPRQPPPLSFQLHVFVMSPVLQARHTTLLPPTNLATLPDPSTPFIRLSPFFSFTFRYSQVIQIDRNRKIISGAACVRVQHSSPQFSTRFFASRATCIL